jgi:hypothetical protein
MMPYQKRIMKKRLKKLLNKILEKGYFVNCNYHPVRLTEYGWGKWDHVVDGVALTTGRGCSCCLRNCSPEPITETRALEMVEVWTNGGDRALAVRYGGYTEEQYTEFEKMWR